MDGGSFNAAKAGHRSDFEDSLPSGLYLC